MAEKVKLFRKLLVHPKSLLLILIATAAIVVTSVIIELKQSKNEMLELMEKQGHSLLETVLTSSQHALLSYDKIESEVKQRLLGNAVMIKLMYEKGLITNNLLSKIAANNKIYRINIFNNSGTKIFSSNNEIHKGIIPQNKPMDYLSPIFKSESDTLFIGIKPARFLDEQRYALAIAANNRSAIVLNINADELLGFRKQIGFGILLKKVTENKQIIYAALQDEKGIIAGSGNIGHLENIENSKILKNIVSSKGYKWRVLENSSIRAFELLHPFEYDGKVIGIFRLGLSLEPLDRINDRLTRRLIFLGIIFIVFGFITIATIFVRQNFELLSKRFRAIESYSSRIIENVSDGILVIDTPGKIKTVNKSIESLVSNNNKLLIGEEFSEVFSDDICKRVISESSTMFELECMLKDKQRTLLISKSGFLDENNENNTVLVIRDLTEQKKLEEQLVRKDRLTAMGELASSVAHEIRNPLNSIGTITQQLGKDYLPMENEEEFKNLTQLVYKEVRRINETIESFLKFAKPKPINRESFNIGELLEQISTQYTETFKLKNNQIIIDSKLNSTVFWDKSQIMQVFINLTENAIDALEANGMLNIASKELRNGSIEIKFTDSGKGISQDNLKKIFNLYFTTKAKGSGIGLSVVQQIISEHGGIISVESALSVGTTFTIVLPKNT